MATLTYCKGLPTPVDELNELGFTAFEMFLEAYTPIFRAASIETVNHLLSGVEFNKSQWNTHLQQTYGINKRHASGVISSAKGRIDGAKEHRTLHLKTIEGKIKSISASLKKAERKLVLARKFYTKKKWQHSKTGGNFPLSCSLKYKSTNWQKLRFQIHNKKRKLAWLTNKLEHLKVQAINVLVPDADIFMVGSKDEFCVIRPVSGREIKLLFVSLNVENYGLAKPYPLKLVILIATLTDCRHTVLRLGISTAKMVNGLLLCSSLQAL